MCQKKSLPAHVDLQMFSRSGIAGFQDWQLTIRYHTMRCCVPLVLLLQTFNKAVGPFSQSVFHFSTEQAFTGTLEGKLVVWDAVKQPSKSAVSCVMPYNMKAIKLVHLQKDGITVLAIIDK